MTSKYIWFCLMIVMLCPGNAAPAPDVSFVDLASFGKTRSWKDVERDKFAVGVEWDEPRDFSLVEVELEPTGKPRSSDFWLEYWVSSWPSAARGGWTQTDTPWQGSWKKVSAQTAIEESKLQFRFDALAQEENVNAKNWIGTAPHYRRALKLRLVGTADRRSQVKTLRVYGDSRWNQREVLVQSGCEGKPAADLSFTAYNGRIESCSRLSRDPPVWKLSVSYTDHPPSSPDRTILTVKGSKYSFGFSIDDVISQRSLYIRSQGIFIGDARFGDFQKFLRSGLLRRGEDVVSRIDKQPEQSLDRARGEVPALSLTGRASRHAVRYIPLGLPAIREKYGLDFDGNVFINKQSVKAMKEDLARMEWSGDEIYFRIGTGAVPDFRGREASARQSLLENYLPVVTTSWENEGIEFNEEGFVTTVSTLPRAWEARGDEPTLLLLRLTLSNPGAEARKAHVWYYTTPQEELRLSGNMLEARSSTERPYRLRTAFVVPHGAVVLTNLPRGTQFQGRAVHWESLLSPGAQQECLLAIPFRTAPSDSFPAPSLLQSYAKQREGVVSFWKGLLAEGMQLNVPNAMLNNFYKAVLMHIFLTVQRDVGTGLDMCPCGTFDYNMFANETAIQVRLLDMMGLSEDAWRCLRPIVELQGSKPFPGRFQDKSAIFHGVRIDADHDYTHHGYNLNHGWILWTLAEHYLFTRDPQFLRAQLPRILKAADWIISERQSTKQMEEDGGPAWEYGLLPAGQLEDNEEFQYWYAVNAYAYRGLRAAAVAVSEVDPAGGGRLMKEAVNYREDIRRAALRSMALAPVVPLRDGTYVPMVPPRTSAHGREFGWIRNILYGPHAMVDCGVFGPDEEITTWTLQDLEDNLFMAEDSFSIPDSDWFSRGGVALQPNLVNTSVSYMERGQALQALRAIYNTFAISFYPDVTTFTEWVPTLGRSGGPFYKTSDEAAFVTWLRLMLVRESGEDLVLTSAAPRAWFAPTKVIEIKGAATLLGKVNFRVASDSDQGVIRARLDLQGRKELKNVILYLRHPQQKKIRQVEVNGQPWKDLDVDREWIRIPKWEGTAEITAHY